MRVPLSGPFIGQREIDLVVEVLKSGELSLGPRLPEFEEKFASYAGTKFAIAVNSGTSALHLCVRALGIGPEDAVLTTSFSFVASANCVLYEGALPLFVDIDPRTLNIDPREIARFLRERCVTKPGSRFPVDRVSGRKIKAILPVHVFGLPCDMDEIQAIADEYGLHILEDSCEALGAEYKGKIAGTLGAAGVFAFYPNKQMTTGEGGMIVTNDPDLAAACRSMRNQGRDANAAWLQHSRLGYNYRLSEIHCALGIGQLERIGQLLSSRAKVASLYDQMLKSNPSLTLPVNMQDRSRSWFVYVVQLNRTSREPLRDDVLSELRARGIGCQAYFPAIHQQPYFEQYLPQQNGWPLPQTEHAARTCLALPFYSSLKKDDIKYVCASLSEIVQQERAGKQSVLLSA
jgi:perosamine synthetase